MPLCQNQRLRLATLSSWHTTSIPKPSALATTAMAVVASADGFGIDVVCHDESVAKRRRWFWHSGMRRSFRVGHRCLPSKDSESMIAIDPPVDFRVATRKSTGGSIAIIDSLSFEGRQR